MFFCITTFLFFLSIHSLHAEPHPQKIDEWAIIFGPSHNITDFTEKYQLLHVSKAKHIPNTHLFTLKYSINKRRLVEHDLFQEMLLSHGQENVPIQPQKDSPHQILWWEQQKLLQLSKRHFLDSSTSPHKKKRGLGLPFKDPLLPTQWHLHNLTEPSNHVHINVLPVWRRGIYGRGAVIAIIDDGVQHDHPDLEENWLRGEGNGNFKHLNNNINPTNKEWHGTAVAGLAVAVPDGDVCGVGVAPFAKFTGLVLLEENMHSINTDYLAARALSHAPDINHIYSNSWGPVDDGKRKEKPGSLTEKAIKSSIELGRGGLGSLYVWAAGNGKQNRDNCNYDGYANSRYVSTFGAVDFHGMATDYSEPCSALLGVLPSGSGQDTMQTTDLVGGGGHEDGDCNLNFAGTSAAAPIAAGIAALVLQANPGITWLDFQYILKLSAIRNDPQHWSWNRNGAGIWVSHAYGFGIIDANKSVATALDWQLPIVEVSYSYDLPDKIRFDQIPNGRGVQSSIMVKESIVLHHVEVIIDITHNFRGHLDIRLISPYGTESILAEFHDDGNQNYTDWCFTTLLTWGETTNGKWTLTVVETSSPSLPDYNAVLNRWKLNLYGINNLTAYQHLIQVKEEESVWDLRGETTNTKKPPNNSSYEWLQNATDSLWKIILMCTLICGIFVMVVGFIVAFVVRRDIHTCSNPINKDEFIELDSESENSQSSNSV